MKLTFEEEKRATEIIKKMNAHEIDKFHALCALSMVDADAQEILVQTIGLDEFRMIYAHQLQSIAFKHMSDGAQDKMGNTFTQLLNAGVPLPKNKILSPLYKHRMAAKMTQKKLAEESGVNVRQIQRYEGTMSDIANITLANAVALAKVLGITAEDLLHA